MTNRKPFIFVVAILAILFASPNLAGADDFEYPAGCEALPMLSLGLIAGSHFAGKTEDVTENVEFRLKGTPKSAPADFTASYKTGEKLTKKSKKIITGLAFAQVGVLDPLAKDCDEKARKARIEKILSKPISKYKESYSSKTPAEIDREVSEAIRGMVFEKYGF